MKNLRRELHKIPELGFKEFKTKEFILSFLEGKDVEIIEIGETGLGVYFNFNYEKTICIRSELDGLPIIEENENEYASINIGNMHACGHDGHMAILLSLIDDICKKEVEPDVNVLFLFQPSEEVNGGAEMIINSKILDNYHVDEIYALHIWPNLPEGEIYTRYGALLSKPTEFDIEIKGISSHVGNLMGGKDALDVGVKLINQIKLDASVIDNSIVHIGQINSGRQRNIVSDSFCAKGTIRTFNEEIYNFVLNMINQNVNYYSKLYDINISLKVNSSICSLINDDELVKLSTRKGTKLLKYPYYQSDDFALYLQRYKGVYFLLGGGNIPSLHSSTFDFDEEILIKGKDFLIKLITKST